MVPSNNHEIYSQYGGLLNNITLSILLKPNNHEIYSQYGGSLKNITLSNITKTK